MTYFVDDLKMKYELQVVIVGYCADDAFGFFFFGLSLFERDCTGPGKKVDPFLPIGVGGEERKERLEECLFDGFGSFGGLKHASLFWDDMSSIIKSYQHKQYDKLVE